MNAWSGNDWLRLAMRPASTLWAVAARSRNLLYDRGLASVWSLPVPVVSLGNITVGGTGKTPLTIHLARRLIEAGARPLVLSRGYRSRGFDTRIVSDGERLLLGPGEAGDEPFMIARSVPGLPVVVDPDRVRGGREAARLFRPSIILLDDGFQHRRLKRDLDVVLLNAVDPFGRYALLPAGLLREPFSSLARADLFVITHAPAREPLQTLEAVLRRYNSAAPVFRADHRPESLVGLSSSSRAWPAGAAQGQAGRSSPPWGLALGKPDPAPEAGTLADLGLLAKQPVYAFCGVGNPEGFRRTLRAAGARIVGFQAFRDHHRFTPEEISGIASRARESGAGLVVTTEKDAVRIGEVGANPPFYALRIRMQISEEPRLLERITRLVRP